MLFVIFSSVSGHQLRYRFYQLRYHLGHEYPDTALKCHSSPDFNCRKMIFSRVHATLHPALSVGWLVGWSVTLYFFYDFYFWTSLLLPKWSSDLKYGPCPPTCFGSRVSGLIFYEFYFLTSLLLPKWSSDLKYGPCPPACDFGSRVSALVYH